MASTAPSKTDDNDVIIYMDDLANGHATLATGDTFDYSTDHEGDEVVEESIEKKHDAHDLEAKPATPRLLETDNVNNPRPTHGPEIDDLEPEDRVKHDFYPGIDDGLLELDDDDKPVITLLF